MSQISSAAASVREAVARADRLRRQRDASVLLARVAPWAAAALLLASVVSYLAGGTMLAVAIVALAIASAVWTARWRVRRSRPVSDEVATELDRDAALNGELRSAHWFAVRDVADEWIAFHLERAADRLRDVAWAGVYPAVRARRAWAAAVALTLAAFVVPLGLPAWPHSGRAAVTPQALPATVTPDELALLPPELQAQIFDLLAQVEAGTLRADEALARIKRLPGFSNAPPDVQALIADAVDDAARRQQEVARGSTPDDTPAPTTTTDTQWARENMASRMANELARAAEQQASDEQASGESTKSEDGALGEAGEASVGQASAKVPTKDPAAAQGATGMMMQNGANGDPGSAFGGKKGNVRYGIVEASQLSAALKREQVEAVANVDDSDLRNQDKRRKTEQSWSAIRFSRVTRRATFDRARLEAPHVVPEARRPLVERYFIRQPEPPPADAPASSSSAPRAPSSPPSERTR